MQEDAEPIVCILSIIDTKSIHSLFLLIYLYYHFILVNYFSFTAFSQ